MVGKLLAQSHVLFLQFLQAAAFADSAALTTETRTEWKKYRREGSGVRADGIESPEFHAEEIHSPECQYPKRQSENILPLHAVLLRLLPLM